MPVLVAAREERRREMEFEPLPAREFARELRLERAVGEEPRHLVFVLDRHQLEERMRDLGRKRRLARRDALLGRCDLLDPRRVARAHSAALR